MRTFEESWGFQDGVTGNSEQQGPSPSLTQELSGALGCLGPSPCPSRAPQLPGRTMRTLEVACRVHTHPALPLSNMPPPPTPEPSTGTEELRRLDPSKWRGGKGPASSSPPSATPPTLPAVPLQRSRPPSLRYALSLLSPDRPVPGLSFSLLRPKAPSPSARQLSPSLKAPPCTSPHPGQDSKASIHSKTGLWGPAGGGRSGAETGLSAPSSWFQRAPW